MRPRGFTLVETMLTMALTVMAMLIATAIVVNLNRATTTAERYDRLLVDVRSVSEAIALSLRTATVDYAAYADPNHDGSAADRADLGLPQPVLRLVTATGLKTVYQQASDGVVYACTLDPGAGEAATKCDGPPSGASWIPSSSTDSRITAVSFTVVPGSDPYTRTARSTLDCAAVNQLDPVRGICTCTTTADCLPDQVCSGTPSACRIDPATDSLQPRVTVLIDAETKSGQRLKSPIQTTVTSRVYFR